MFARLLASLPFQRFAIKTALLLLPSVLKFGRTVLVLRWNDVADVLRRDDDFRIAPINKARIEGVSGPFFLGMDRCAEYFDQRRCSYSAMASVDFPSHGTDIAARAREAVEASGSKLDIVNGYARPIAAQTAANIFGIHGDNPEAYMSVARSVFEETFLNLSGDTEVERRGRAAGSQLSKWTRAEIALRRDAQDLGQDFLGALLADEKLSDDAVANIVNGFVIGAMDTTATATTNILFELISDETRLKNACADVDNPRRMMGWCLEALRQRPHNPLLVREAASNTQIAGKAVQQGDRVFAITFAAHHDPAAFPSPGHLDPTRPFRRYMHFGFGPHVCAGRDLNAVQIPTLVAEVLRQGPKNVSDIEFEGPFPNKMFVGF